MSLQRGAASVQKALALLTLAHERYSEDDAAAAVRDALDEADDVNLSVVLGDENGYIDWQGIALGMSIIADLLLDAIPNMVYDAMEAKWGTAPDRLTGTRLLQVVSLHLSEVDTPGAE